MKTFWTFIVLILSASASCAQSDTFEGNFLFTPGYTSISGSRSISTYPAKPFSGKFGFSAGFSVSRNISKNAYLKMGLQYSNRGTRYRFYYSPTAYRGGFFHIDYIELPLMFGFSPYHDYKEMKIETGFSFGRFLHCNPFFETQNFIDYSLSEINPIDISIVANCLFPISTKPRNHITLGPSFSHSLIRINPNYNFYNFSLGFMMNYRI